MHGATRYCVYLEEIVVAAIELDLNRRARAVFGVSDAQRLKVRREAVDALAVDPEEWKDGAGVAGVRARIELVKRSGIVVNGDSDKHCKMSATQVVAASKLTAGRRVMTVNNEETVTERVLAAVRRWVAEAAAKLRLCVLVKAASLRVVEGEVGRCRHGQSERSES